MRRSLLSWVSVLGLLATATAFAQPSSTSPLAPPANGPRRADATWVALTNCTVHVAPGRTLQRATVVFRDGVITRVIEEERVTMPKGDKTMVEVIPADPPPGAFAIDCTGLHVYPGFIDPYVEVDAPAPAGDASTKHWSPKVTPQRSALDGAGVDAATAESLRKLGFTTAVISPKGGVFRGTSAVVSLAKPADDASAARPPVYMDRVYQSVAFELGGGYPSSQMGAIALIRQTLLDADWQQEARKAGETIEPNCLDALGTPPFRGGSSDSPQASGTNATNKTAAERRGTQSQTPLLFTTDDELEALRCIKIADEFSRPFLLLGSGTEYQRLAALDAALRVKHVNKPMFRSTLLLPLNFPKAPDVASIGKAETIELRELMHWEQAPTNPRRVAASGLGFALTTAKLRDKGDFRKNLQTAIKHGLTEEQALQALTVTPAQLFGLAGTLGTIESGKRANLILADGPIFGDKTKLRSVYIDGVAHEINAAPIELDGRWDVLMAGKTREEVANDPTHVERWLSIDKDNAITLHRGKKSVKASKVSVEKEKVSFTFDHEPLDGVAGVYVATAILERDGGPQSDPVRMSGVMMRPNGEQVAFNAWRTPASPLIGSWKVIEADGVQFDPKDKKGLTISITDGGATLTFVKDKKKDTNAEGAEKEAEGAEKKDPEKDVEKKEPGKTDPAKPATPPARPTEKPGVNKVDTADGTEKPAQPAEKTDKKPDADQPEAGKDANKPDGDRRKRDDADLVIKCEDVVLKGDTLTFTHDLSKLGTEGKSTDTIKLQENGPGREDDTFTGEGVMPDGSRHTYKAIRTPREGTEIAPGLWATDDELTRIKAIPEKLPTPFGPYGLEELPKQSTVIFRNATVWTNTDQGIVKNGTVVIAEGKVAGVFGGNSDIGVALPTREKPIEIDLQGKHITPGIIDAHSHTGISRGVNEGAQAVSAEVRIADVTDPDTVDWYRQLAGGVTGVLSLHGSANAMGGQSQTNKLRWGCAHPDDMHFEGSIPGIKFALGENPRQVNFGGGQRTGPVRYPSTRMGVEQIIRDRFTAAREYDELRVTDQFRSSAQPPRRRDLELEALAEILRGERLVHCHSYRQDEMVMLFNVARDFNFKIGTLQHALEAYKVADGALQFTGGASGFADWWAYKVEVQDAIPGAFPIMHDVGLLVSYNSDSNELARRLNVDAAKAVKYGRNITPEQALKFITLNPAKQLRIDSKVGSLEPGKDADLVVWSGEPLSAFSKAEQTYVDGRCLFSLEQDAKHRETIRSERERLIQKILADGKKKSDGDKPEGDRADGAARPEGAPAGGGRRRRPPQDANASYDYYMNLFTSGKRPGDTPGECGEDEVIVSE